MKTQTVSNIVGALKPFLMRGTKSSTTQTTLSTSTMADATSYGLKDAAVTKNDNKMAVCALRRSALLGFATLAFLALALSAQAGNLVTNGGFETTTNGPCQFDYCTTAPPWSSSGYNFIFGYGTADTTGSNGQDGNLRLWGPNDGSNNGMPAGSPDGGNFVAADGSYGVAPIQQTIPGLTAGDKYTVGFWWAGAQNYGFTSPTTEQWQVGLGGQTQDTVVLQNPSHGFTGWRYQSFTFTADNSSDVLSFLAVGTPAGEPPFVLLDGVTMYAATPEPGTLALMIGGLGGLGALRYKRWFKR